MSIMQAKQVETVLEHFQTEHSPLAGRGGQRKLPHEIQVVLGYIHDNLFAADLSVKVLKSRCHIRDNNVSSRFRRAMGITIKDYIDSMRMEAAGMLLAHPSRIGVFDVAFSVGYEHPQTFYRVFHRKFKCTPAVYRKTSRKNTFGPTSRTFCPMRRQSSS